MAKVYSQTTLSAVVPATNRQLWHTALAGFIVGGVTWGVAWLLNTYIFSTILCRGELADRCLAAPNYAAATAMIVVGGLGLFALVRLQAFRPLLVVLATLVALWGILTLTNTFVWYSAILVTSAIFAISYALFGWIVRLRSFIMAALVTVVVIVAVRLALTA